MKIKLSLRLYLLSAIVVFAIGIIVLFTMVTTSYFVNGLDSITRISMIESIHDTKGASITSDFTYSDNWESVPQNIREHFANRTIDKNILYKHVESENFWSRPNRISFLMKVDAPDGNLVYISKLVDTNAFSIVGDSPSSIIVQAISIGVAISALFIVIIVLMIRSITRPVESLNTWTKSLSFESLCESPPDFRYTELNKFAELMMKSLNAAHTSIEREQTFLRHASHELRTPIATVSNSVELLKRLYDVENEKVVNVVARIERAGKTMKNLTEILLWLSREDDSSIVIREVKLNSLIEDIYADMGYLLEGKQNIEVSVSTEVFSIFVSPEACRVIISNIIRNALQHTIEGSIKITQSANQLKVENTRSSKMDDESSEIGFGLGLNLCRQLSGRFGWSMTIEKTETTYSACIIFT